MLIEWNDFVAFLRTRAQELGETQFDQVRYGDVGMALVLALVISVALLLTLSRVAFWRRNHSRHHSGHLIDPKLQRGTIVRALYHSPKLLLVMAVVGTSGRCVRSLLNSD